MVKLYDRLTTKKEKDLRVLADFVEIYCREKHRDATRSAFPIRDERLESLSRGRDLTLCQECEKLLNHGIAKLLQCRQDPKPMCKKCKIQCYAPGYRQKIREVMKFSGLYLVRHGRLDLVLHYFL
jgi:hypothetical protein